MPVIRAFSHLTVIQRSAIRMRMTESLKSLHADERDDEAKAEAIIDALTRLETVDYGVCADCSAAISWPRLMVHPETLRCLGCEMRFERTAAHAA